MHDHARVALQQDSSGVLVLEGNGVHQLAKVMWIRNLRNAYMEIDKNEN